MSKVEIHRKGGPEIGVLDESTGELTLSEEGQRMEDEATKKGKKKKGSSSKKGSSLPSYPPKGSPPPKGYPK